MFTNHRAYREYSSTQQWLSDIRYENYEWLEEFYAHHPEYERPEWLDHYFDRDRWEKQSRLTWRDSLKSGVKYIAVAVVIVLVLRYLAN